MNIFRQIDWSNKEEIFYDPKLLLSDEELEQIKDRNKENEDIQKLLDDVETYKKIIMMYESL